MTRIRIGVALSSQSTSLERGRPCKRNSFVFASLQSSRYGRSSSWMIIVATPSALRRARSKLVTPFPYTLSRSCRAAVENSAERSAAENGKLSRRTRRRKRQRNQRFANQALDIGILPDRIIDWRLSAFSMTSGPLTSGCYAQVGIRSRKRPH